MQLSGWLTQNTSKAKVAELDDAGFGEEYVLWLYITVDALQHKHLIRDLGKMMQEAYSKADRMIMDK